MPHSSLSAPLTRGGASDEPPAAVESERLLEAGVPPEAEAVGAVSEERDAEVDPDADAVL